MDTVRYGIIGTGLMGFEHIRNLRLLPGARVTARASAAERRPVELAEWDL